ncbi:MAG: peptidase T [Caldisericum exile]|uniref:Peptidase T n=1 Tax=Caldisericum exile TaxID=693075 RepID=A0A2J6X8S2_9BACT|nr:MAG: peptidase T [Caldisericum exile]
MNELTERFIRYVKVNTQSKEDSETFPSTSQQLELANIIKEDLNKLGFDANVSEFGYVYTLIPRNIETDVPKVGFLAHLDTSPEVSGQNVNPKIIEKYNGTDIILNHEKGIILSKEKFPILEEFIGHDLIVTDGKTLLGADDKAGIVEIIQAIKEIKEQNLPHGDIYVVFTPDEEVGRGVDKIDLSFFKPDFAYTVDGEGYGVFEYENFNAALLKYKIHGINTHPGTAKGAMKNAIRISQELMFLFPSLETPEATEGYEGFYHFYEINGGVEELNLKAIIRDHNKTKFQFRKYFAENIANFLNDKYGEGTVSIEIKDQYYNMKEIIEQHPEILDIAKKAFEKAGLEFKTKPIRGGTDGARLTYMGIPTPNIFSGGHNYHSIYEFASIQAMEKAKEVVKNIITLIAKAF